MVLFVAEWNGRDLATSLPGVYRSTVTPLGYGTSERPDRSRISPTEEGITMTNPTPAPAPTQQNQPDLWDDIVDTIKGRFNRLRGRRSDTHVSALKVIAFVLTIVLWTYGFYYGYVALPALDALGGALGIIVLVLAIIAVIATVKADSTTIRVIGLLGAVVLTIVFMTLGGDIRGLFADFTVANTLGMLLAVVWTVAVAFWICRSVNRPAPQPAPVAHAHGPAPAPTTTP